MASIYQRKSKTGKGHTWRAVIRRKGHPTICETFSRKKESEDWAREIEYQVKVGQYNTNQSKIKKNIFTIIQAIH